MVLRGGKFQFRNLRLLVLINRRNYAPSGYCEMWRLNSRKMSSNC